MPCQDPASAGFPPQLSPDRDVRSTMEEPRHPHDIFGAIDDVAWLEDICNRPSLLMDLPRELRDQIYDLLGHDSRLKSTTRPSAPAEGLMKVELCSGPSAALLRVGKQFSSEYEARARRLSSLKIRDNRMNLEDASICYDPLPLRYARSVNFETATFMHQARDDIFALAETKTAEWINYVRSVSTAVVDLRVEIHLCGLNKHRDRQFLQAAVYAAKIAAASDTSEDKKFLAGIVDCQGMKEVKLLYTACERPFFCATWAPKNGWQSEKIEEVQSAEKTQDAAV